MTPGNIVAISVVGGFVYWLGRHLVCELVEDHDRVVREAGFQAGVAVERGRWVTATKKAAEICAPASVPDEEQDMALIEQDIETLSGLQKLDFHPEDWA